MSGMNLAGGQLGSENVAEIVWENIVGVWLFKTELHLASMVAGGR